MPFFVILGFFTYVVVQQEKRAQEIEKKNKIIILALIVVIAALLVGIFATIPNAPNKESTNLTFKCKSVITEGDSIKIQLTDANGTAIANQNVNVTITDKTNASNYHSVTTNAKGVGTLNIDKKAGNYIITIKYGGNDNYTECNATKKIKIEEKVVEATVEPANSDDSSGQTNGNKMPEETRKVYAARQKAAEDGIPMYVYTKSPELVEKYQAMV